MNPNDPVYAPKVYEYTSYKVTGKYNIDSTTLTLNRVTTMGTTLALGQGIKLDPIFSDNAPALLATQSLPSLPRNS
jgi:hypothetical protein